MRLVPGILLAAVLFAAETKLGKPLNLKQAVPVGELLSKPGQYAGKIVQVKGKIAAVCQMAGCWMMLADGSGNSIRIKVDDGAIVFPKDSAGKTAIAEGKFVKIDLTKAEAIERARHEAAEQGRKFEEGSIRRSTTIYQIEGSGAVLID